MNALDRVPRLSREKIEMVMNFNVRLTSFISMLGYSNLKLIDENEERRKADQALLESEERYHNLFEENKAVILLIDPATLNIIDVNQAACDYYGYDRETMLRMNKSDINTLDPLNLRKEIDEALRMERRHFEYKHRLSSGRSAMSRYIQV